jgi:hypothetical protein
VIEDRIRIRRNLKSVVMLGILVQSQTEASKGRRRAQTDVPRKKSRDALDRTWRWRRR